MIKGYAELTSTNQYFEKKKILPEVIRSTEWFSSLPIAMGTHLGDFSDSDSQKYMETMIFGIENGINFIDTAINYRGMRSEKDVGKVLNEVINIRRTAKREELIISTKCGLILGDITERLRPSTYFEKILAPLGIQEDDFNEVEGWDKHTLTPSFYEHTILKSRQNLNLETIDIHYIHIPEISRNALGEEVFYNRLRELFLFYEKQVSINNIRFYGLATEEAFLHDYKSKWYISLEKVCSVAEEVAGKSHHFRFVQLPYNMIERTAATNEYQKVLSNSMTVIEAANKLGIHVIVNMPLNLGKIEKGTTVNEMLHFVTDEPGVLAAMVGSKNQDHVRLNMNGYI